MTKARWLARLLSLATLTLVGAFAFSGVEPFIMPAGREWILLACFLVGLLLWFAIAWRHETLVGAVGVGSVAAVYMFDFAFSGIFPRGSYFALLALPALLFLGARPAGAETAEPSPAGVTCRTGVRES